MFISLGSNLGDRGAYIAGAIPIVGAADAVRVSNVYETEPVGGVVQDDFWNVVVEVLTGATPYEMLERCRAAERAAARVRDLRWGPRTLDADVVLFGDLRSDDPELILPHPRMWERAFVLVPLRELAPELVSHEQVAASGGRVSRLGTLESLG